MSRQHWNEALWWATADGTAVDDTTTEEIIFPNVTIPANYMQDGRCLEISASGRLSTTGTPTITFAIRWGGVGGTLLATTEPITCANNSSNVAWSLSATIQTRANGASGSLFVMGDVKVNLTASTHTSGVFGSSGFDAPAAVTVNLTADTALSVTADWSAASASNTLTGHLYKGLSIN